MSDKEVLKAIEEEKIDLKRYYNEQIRTNLDAIAGLMEEQGRYVQQMVEQGGELSILMLTYHYELLSDEIGEIRTMNRKIMKDLNDLQ